MARPFNVIRPTSLHVFLPEDIRAKLDIHLYSAVEGRVPQGAYGRFIAGLVREFFEPKSVNVKTQAEKLLTLTREVLLQHQVSVNPDGGVDYNNDEVINMVEAIDVYFGALNDNPIS